MAEDLDNLGNAWIHGLETEADIRALNAKNEATRAHILAARAIQVAEASQRYADRFPTERNYTIAKKLEQRAVEAKQAADLLTSLATTLFGEASKARAVTFGKMEPQVFREEECVVCLSEVPQLTFDPCGLVTIFFEQRSVRCV